MYDPIFAQHVTNTLYEERVHRFGQGRRRPVGYAARTKNDAEVSAGLIRWLLGGWPRRVRTAHDTAEALHTSG